MIVSLGIYILRNERSSVNAALVEKNRELNRQPAMKDETVMAQTARKMAMCFHSSDCFNSMSRGEEVPYPVSSSSSSCSLLWRMW